MILRNFFGRKPAPVDEEAEVVRRPGEPTGPTKPGRDTGKGKPTDGPGTNIKVWAGPEGNKGDKVRPTCSSLYTMLCELGDLIQGL